MDPTQMTPDEQRTTRRQVIGLALDRRPELTPADLLRILRKLDLPLTPATLAEDLRAADVEMVPGADGAVTLRRAPATSPGVATPAGSEPEATAPPATETTPASELAPETATVSVERAADGVGQSSAAPVTARPTVDEGPPPDLVRFAPSAVAVSERPSAVADAGGVDDEPLPPVYDPFAPKARRLRWGPILLIVLGLLAIVVSVVGWLSTADPDRARTATPSATSAASGSGPRVAPSGPGADPELFGQADGADGFEPDGAGLGPSSGAGPWTVLGGTWEVGGGEARVIGGPEGEARLVVTDLGSVDVRAQVLLVDPVQGAGLAFRVVDARNYWLWAAAPGFRTFTLYEVVDGVATARGDSGITEQGPGTRIGVRTLGRDIELLANGVVVHRAVDEVPEGMAHGLGALPEVAAAAFDDFAFRLDG